MHTLRHGFSLPMIELTGMRGDEGNNHADRFGCVVVARTTGGFLEGSRNNYRDF